MIELDWQFKNITRNVHFIKNEHNSKNVILFHPNQIKIIFSITAVSTRHFWLEMHCKEHFNSTSGNIIYSSMQNSTALISYINNYKNLVHFKMLKILNFNFALSMLLTGQQIPNQYGFSIKATQLQFCVFKLEHKRKNNLIISITYNLNLKCKSNIYSC